MDSGQSGFALIALLVAMVIASILASISQTSLKRCASERFKKTIGHRRNTENVGIVLC